MKAIIIENDITIYKVGDEYIMIDTCVDDVICVFRKRNSCVYYFQQCDGYCFANHDTYKELIDRV